MMPPPAKDPWHILGLQRGASAAEVRARYKELAREHHPDKLSHLSAAERQRHEEIFKEISVAYRFIAEGGGAHAAGSPGWESLWQQVEAMFQRPDVWETMGVLLKDAAAAYAARKAAASAASSAPPPPTAHPDDGFTTASSGGSSECDLNYSHMFELAVSLEDIHANKPKRLRLFLKGQDDPVYVKVFCGSYPEFRTFVGDHHIIVSLLAQPHPLFRTDTVFGTGNLYTEVHISWAEYLTGATRRLVYLDGSEKEVPIPAFHPAFEAIVIEGAGLGLRGHADEKLYITVVLEPPAASGGWAAMSETDRKSLVQSIAALGPQMQGDPTRSPGAGAG